MISSVRQVELQIGLHAQRGLISAGLLALMCAVGCGAGAAGPGTTSPGPNAPAGTASSEAEAGPGDASGVSGAPQAEPGDDSGPASERVYDLEGMRIAVAGRDADGEPILVSYDPESLLRRGNDALARGLPEAAQGSYEQLVREFPNSRLVPAALYNLGLASEAMGQPDQAIGHYRRLAQVGAGRDAIDAQMRIAAVEAELARWAQARTSLDTVLGRDDLSAGDRIEGLARLGYVALEQGDEVAAQDALDAALAIYDRLNTALDSNYFVAMSHYYLAQIHHRQLLAWPMRLPSAQLRRDLDAKAQLLTTAYDRYLLVLDFDEAY